MNAAKTLFRASTATAATKPNRNVVGGSRSALSSPIARSFGSGGGSRGARGHGWWINYRAGKGGRHLQGEYSHLDVESLREWNDAVFSLGSQRVFMDVELEPVVQREDDGKKNDNVHRLSIELASAVFPKAVDNFVRLLEASQDGYRSTTLHRIERNVGFVGGNVWKNTGRCSDEHRMATSLVSMQQNEHMVLSHLPGVLTMLSQRVKEIDSRFIMCTDHAPHMDGMALAVGRLEETSLQTLQQWKKDLITRNGRPTTVNLRIVDCGHLDEPAIEEQSA